MSSKLTALTELNYPSFDDLLYVVDSPSGTPVSRKATIGNTMGLLNGLCDGRLTVKSGDPCPSGNYYNQASVYFTPYEGNCVSLYDGTGWSVFELSELTLSLSGLASGSNYDLFVYESGSAPVLKNGPAWSSDTSRGTGGGTTELETVDGVPVNKHAITNGPPAQCGRYVGTFRAVSATQTEQSFKRRYLWNKYNQQVTGLSNAEYTTHTYASPTAREWNNASDIRVHFVLGERQCVGGHFTQFGDSSQLVGMNFDTTTAALEPHYFGNGLTPQPKVSIVIPHQTVEPGYHYATIVESAPTSASQNFYQAFIDVEFMS